MNHRDVMQQALDALERGAWDTVDGRNAAEALREELAKPAAVPDTCRQKLKKEGKPYPRSSCNFCGQLSPRWRDCDAMLYASPQPTAPAVSPVDIQAVREVIAYLRDFADHDSADQLARAIGETP